jgi:hypothetical protein
MSLTQHVIVKIETHRQTRAVIAELADSAARNKYGNNNADGDLSRMQK